MEFSCSALWITLFLAHWSRLKLVGTLRLTVNLIITVCILNSQVIAAHCKSFDMSSEE